MWDKAIRSLNKLTESITMSLLLAMVCLVLLQVFSRILIGSSFSWTNELARYMLVWLVFLGGGIVFQHGAHIGMEALVEKFSANIQRIIQILVSVICILFFIILIVIGTEFSNTSMTLTSPALKIPMGIVYSVIPISGVLQIINVLDITFKIFIRKNV